MNEKEGAFKCQDTTLLKGAPDKNVQNIEFAMSKIPMTLHKTCIIFYNIEEFKWSPIYIDPPYFATTQGPAEV